MSHGRARKEEREGEREVLFRFITTSYAHLGGLVVCSVGQGLIRCHTVRIHSNSLFCIVPSWHSQFSWFFSCVTSTHHLLILCIRQTLQLPFTTLFISTCHMPPSIHFCVNSMPFNRHSPTPPYTNRFDSILPRIHWAAVERRLQPAPHLWF